MAQQREECTVAGTVIFVVVFVIVFWRNIGTHENPVYQIGIDAVAGLNPGTDLARPTLNPEFDLRVSINEGLWGAGDAAACLELGSSVAVSYRRVPLAAAAVPARRCGGPGSVVPIVARGSGVSVPWAVRDALAWDLYGLGSEDGATEFDVTLTVPFHGRWKVVSCKAKVGHWWYSSAKPLLPCDVSVVGTLSNVNVVEPAAAAPQDAAAPDAPLVADG